MSKRAERRANEARVYKKRVKYRKAIGWGESDNDYTLKDMTTPCSCEMCCNARRRCTKDVTVQEKKADITFNEYMEEDE